MTSSVAGLFDLLTQKMNWLTQKQAVLAENVSNANTPDYKQLEVAPLSFDSTLHKVQMGMAVTDPRHIVPAALRGVNAKTFASKDVEVSASGNSVDLEKQMMEVSKTGIEYQTVTAIYHKMMGLMKISIKGTSS